MESGTVIGIIAAVVLLLIVLWYVSIYNRLIRLRNEAERAWSNIDVLLQERYDLLPNLVETVKAFTKHEGGLWEQFAQARQMASNARSAGDIGALGRAEGMLSNIMPQVYAVAEQYPDLKSQTNFSQLHSDTVAMENQIADRREYYNASATNWNMAIEMIPSNIVASTMGARRKELFEVEGAARDAPKFNFGEGAATSRASRDRKEAHEMELAQIEQQIEIEQARQRLEALRDGD